MMMNDYYKGLSLDEKEFLKEQGDLSKDIKSVKNKITKSHNLMIKAIKEIQHIYWTFDDIDICYKELNPIINECPNYHKTAKLKMVQAFELLNMSLKNLEAANNKYQSDD